MILQANTISNITVFSLIRGKSKLKNPFKYSWNWHRYYQRSERGVIECSFHWELNQKQYWRFFS